LTSKGHFWVPIRAKQSGAQWVKSDESQAQ